LSASSRIFFGERDRLARDDIFGDRGGRVDARRPPGGIAGLARRPGAAARLRFGERLLRRRRLQQCREDRLLRLGGRDLPLFRPDFALTLPVHRPYPLVAADLFGLFTDRRDGLKTAN
jgi:hypothetical protein